MLLEAKYFTPHKLSKMNDNLANEPEKIETLGVVPLPAALV